MVLTLQVYKKLLRLLRLAPLKIEFELESRLLRLLSTEGSNKNAALDALLGSFRAAMVLLAQSQLLVFKLLRLLMMVLTLQVYKKLLRLLRLAPLKIEFELESRLLRLLSTEGSNKNAALDALLGSFRAAMVLLAQSQLLVFKLLRLLMMVLTLQVYKKLLRLLRLAPLKMEFELASRLLRLLSTEGSNKNAALDALPGSFRAAMVFDAHVPAVDPMVTFDARSGLNRKAVLDDVSK